jgi:hypothetical protein
MESAMAEDKKNVEIKKVEIPTIRKSADVIQFTSVDPKIVPPIKSTDQSTQKTDTGKS